MRAKVARFYGWEASSIDNMSMKSFMEYYSVIGIITAEEQLKNIEASIFGNIKKEKRREIIGKYQRQIKSGIDRTEGKLATVQDLAKSFARMQNGR